jgi:hypothetical protein
VTTARQFGSAPTTRELVDRLLVMVAEQGERLEVLEAKVAGADGDEDARSPARPSAPEWLPLIKACAVTGYSEVGLRRRIRHHDGGPRWWRCYAGRAYVHVVTAPRKRKLRR